MAARDTKKNTAYQMAVSAVKKTELEEEKGRGGWGGDFE